MKHSNETYTEALNAGRLELQDIEYMADCADEIADMEDQVISL